MGRRKSGCFPSFLTRLFKKDTTIKSSVDISETSEDRVTNGLKVSFDEELEDDDVFEEEVSNKGGRVNCLQQSDGFDFRTRSSFKAMLLRTPLLSSKKQHTSNEAECLTHKMGFLGQIYVGKTQMRERFKSASSGSLASRTKHNSSSSDASAF